MSIYKKLMEARISLQNTKLQKSGHNKFAGYQYFELGDFLPTVQEIFSKVGLCGIVSFSPDVASLTIFETDGDGAIVFTSPMGSAALKGCHEVQNIGAVETYQRRYLWVTAMEIVEHDALDAGEQKDAPQDKTYAKPYDTTIAELNKAARKGTKALEEAWKALTPDKRVELKDRLQGLKEAASMQDIEIETQA